MEDAPVPELRFSRWISNKEESGYVREYDEIFKQLLENSSRTSSVSSEDTSTGDILYVRGLIYDDDTVELLQWRFFDSESPSSVETGDYAIKTLDSDGTKLSERSFHLSFKLYYSTSESSRSPVKTDVSAFSFAIPYPEEARSVEITRNDKTLLELEANIKLLRDAIDAIPEDGFINGENIADQRRKALHNKIDAVDRMLEKENIRGAIQKLNQDVTQSVEKWLKEDYNVDNIEQVMKEEILTLIDGVTARLESDL